MFKNYFISAYRSLISKPVFTIINVIGLAIGMATCLMITLYVNYDLSYDTFQKEDVYRIALTRIYPERKVDYAFIPHSIGPQLVEDYPEVLASARLFKVFNPVNMRFGDDSYNEGNVIFADSTLFELLEIPLIKGDPESALLGTNSLVISERIAKKYFGDEDPIGKQLESPNGPLIITAVAQDYWKNSHFDFDFIIPMMSIPFFQQENWAGFSVHNYIKLSRGTSPNSLEEKIPAFIKKYAEGEIQRRNGISYDEYVAAGNGYDYFLQPIEDIYLHSNLEGELKANGNIRYIYIFSIVAVFILLLATINFMNLSTARSTERAKEVGVRKVLGSIKRQIIGQFLTESVFISILSAAIALAFIALILPQFAELSGRPLSYIQLSSVSSIALISLLVLMIGILAGMYPAFLMSRFQPVQVLKGQMRSGKAGVLLRNILVVLQFTISIGLISTTLLVFNQMNYLLNRPLGFNKTNKIVVENAFSINGDQNEIHPEKFISFRNDLVKENGIVNAGYTSAMPGDILPGFIVRVPGTGEKESMVTRAMSVSEDLFETLNMKVVKGRGFSKEFNDSLSMILSEGTVTKLAIDDPIGKKIIHVDNDEQTEYTIIGVIRDFYFQSLHVELEPMVLLSLSGPQAFINKLVVEVGENQTRDALSIIEKTWNGFVPETPFQYYFLDSDLEEFYSSEKTSGQLFSLFTVLAIIIACIGLLGLSSYVIHQKTKEIGIRKAMGASVSSIVMLLVKDFTKLIILATLISVPFAYIWMDNWLNNFAYKVNINWVVFVLSGVAALAIGLLTVSIQSSKAAIANPVDSLRSE